MRLFQITIKPYRRVDRNSEWGGHMFGWGEAGKRHPLNSVHQPGERPSREQTARRLYILGKSTILDLNAAITEKDTARRNYITALKTYWSLYYGIRSMTGYDFLRKAEISCTIPKP